MLELLAIAPGPDTYVELPFVLPESPAQARNASKDLPPPPPIVELLTKKWLLHDLIAELDSFASGVEPDDDQTLLLVAIE